VAQLPDPRVLGCCPFAILLLVEKALTDVAGTVLIHVVVVAFAMALKPFDSDLQGRQFAEALVSAYIDPSFGARTKREIDHLLVKLLIAHGRLDPECDPFALARAFNITPAQAKALIFAWQLRSRATDKELRQRLAQHLASARFVKDGALIVTAIPDKMVREFFKASLREHGIVSDGSFATEIVRLSLEGLVDYLSLECVEQAEVVRRQLVKQKLLPDTGVRAILKEIVVKAAGKIGDKAVGNLAGKAVDEFSTFLGGLLGGRGTTAAKAAADLLEV
jgi:hypothetical protein